MRGLAVAEAARPRDLELVAFACAALGAVAAVAQVFGFVTELSNPIVLLAEISIALALIALAGVLALVRARFAARDMPAARALG